MTDNAGRPARKQRTQRKPKKSPAFQFYPSNFLGSPKVISMTAEEIGIYWLLLCLDWEERGFTFEEAEQFIAAWRVSPATLRAAWRKIVKCFERDGERFTNGRLRAERSKQDQWRRKSSKGGKIGSAKRWEKADKGGHQMVSDCSQPNDDTPLLSPSPTPVTTKTTTSPRAARRDAKPSWILPASRIWEGRFGAGSFPWGEFGSQCKRLKEHHDGPTIADHLRRYLERTETQFVSSARFAKTFAEYGPTDPNALVDEWGCLTERGERETRPAGLRIA